MAAKRKTLRSKAKQQTTKTDDAEQSTLPTLPPLTGLDAILFAKKDSKKDKRESKRDNFLKTIESKSASSNRISKSALRRRKRQGNNSLKGNLIDLMGALPTLEDTDDQNNNTDQINNSNPYNNPNVIKTKSGVSVSLSKATFIEPEVKNRPNFKKSRKTYNKLVNIEVNHFGKVFGKNRADPFASLRASMANMDQKEDFVKKNNKQQTQMQID